MSLRESATVNRFRFYEAPRGSSATYATYNKVRQADELSQTPLDTSNSFDPIVDESRDVTFESTSALRRCESTGSYPGPGSEPLSGSGSTSTRRFRPMWKRNPMTASSRPESVERFSPGSSPTAKAAVEKNGNSDSPSLNAAVEGRSTSDFLPSRITSLSKPSRSRHSILEIVSSKLGPRWKMNRSSVSGEVRQEMGYVNSAHIIESAPASTQIRKQRRKELEELFGKKRRHTSVVDPSSGNAESTGNNDDREFWTGGAWVFDPAGQLAYWWSFVVSIAFLYNFWVLIYRFAFEEVHPLNMVVWFAMDYTADFIYLLDVLFHFRTGYLEDGVLQTDSTKLRKHYINSTRFYVDCLSLLPLDFLYLSVGIKSALRSFRLVKIYRYWAFLDHTERHTNYPNIVRAVTLLHYLLAIYHWNACLINTMTMHFNRDDNWRYSRHRQSNETDIIMIYLHSLYWSTLALTTSGHLPTPSSKAEHAFVIFQIVFGLLLFATILGHVSNIVTSISAARKDFQTKLDNVKTFMSLRRVPMRLQDRVIKWFDYLWMTKKSSSEEKTLRLLPDKLKAEIALHVHLDTLKRVEIFQNTEAGFLCELVLRLRPVLFSPGDYICRKGEVGKEMYIVNRGRLQVVADNGRTVLATLRPGSYFGEISILNMGNAGNRRTASVRSVGYSDLFCLSKNDLWEVLKDYPKARIRLEAIAVKKLENDLKKSAERAAAAAATAGAKKEQPNFRSSKAADIPLPVDKADSVLAGRSISVSGGGPETGRDYRAETRDQDATNSSSLDSCRDYVTMTSSSQQTTSGTPIVIQFSQGAGECAAELHSTPPELVPSRFLPPAATLPFSNQLGIIAASTPPPPGISGFIVPQEIYAVAPGCTGLLTPVRFMPSHLSQTNLVYNQSGQNPYLLGTQTNTSAFAMHEHEARTFPVHQPVPLQPNEHRHSGDYQCLGFYGTHDRLGLHNHVINKAGSTGCLPDTTVSPDFQTQNSICRELFELRERLRAFESKMAAKDSQSSPYNPPNCTTSSDAYYSSKINLTSTQFV